MGNAHLLAHLGWVACKFKLWSGIRYGISIPSIPLAAARRVLHTKNFHSLSFLGINQNVKKREENNTQSVWMIGLFSFAVEQTIGMINIFAQH